MYMCYDLSLEPSLQDSSNEESQGTNVFCGNLTGIIFINHQILLFLLTSEV